MSKKSFSKERMNEIIQSITLDLKWMGKYSDINSFEQMKDRILENVNIILNEYQNYII